MKKKSWKFITGNQTKKKKKKKIFDGLKEIPLNINKKKKQQKTKQEMNSIDLGIILFHANLFEAFYFRKTVYSKFKRSTAYNSLLVSTFSILIRWSALIAEIPWYPPLICVG